MARLDAELVTRGIAGSRERAKEMIKQGAVSVNGTVVEKSSFKVSSDDEIKSAEQKIYVGRGALKLEKAYEVFQLDFVGKSCLDIGASTGGFTEFMIQHGAEKVYAVDVGHGQLAESLRHENRVVNMESTDIRNVSSENIGGEVDFICADVSFISLTKIIPKIYELLKNDSVAVVLIKPQFEAGRKDIGKKGVVKDRKVHERVLAEIDNFFRITGFAPLNYTFSPIKGGSGNIEYLTELEKSSANLSLCDFRKLIAEAFGCL